MLRGLVKGILHSWPASVINLLGFALASSVCMGDEPSGRVAEACLAPLYDSSE